MVPFSSHIEKLGLVKFYFVIQCLTFILSYQCSFTHLFAQNGVKGNLDKVSISEIFLDGLPVKFSVNSNFYCIWEGY